MSVLYRILSAWGGQKGWVLFHGGVSPPAGGEWLCPRRQSHQNAAGDGSRWALCAHSRLSPDPVYGGYPLNIVRPFRRAKSGVPGCDSVRPHGGPAYA